MDAIKRYTATERLLRNHLAAAGWDDDGIRIDELELAHVERPGWVQFFVFRVRVPEPSGSDEDATPSVVRTLHGVIRDDGRQQFEVRFAPDARGREEVLAEWSERAVRPPRRSTAEAEARWSERFFLILVVLFVGTLVAALFVSLSKSLSRRPAAVDESVVATTIPLEAIPISEQSEREQ